MFEKLAVRTRVMAGFALVLALFVAVAAMSVWRSQEFGRTTDYILVSKLHNERLMSELQTIIDVNITQTVSAAKVADPAYEATLLAANKKGSVRAVEIFDELNHTVSDPVAKQILADVERERSEYLAARERLAQLKKAGDGAAVDAFIGATLRGEADQYVAAVNKLVARQHELINQLAQATHAENAQSIRLTVGMTIAAVLLGVGAAVVVGRSVVRQLGGEPAQAAHVAHRIAEGDLTVEVPLAAGDSASVLHAMHVMRARLSDIVRQVRQGTGAIATASAEIAHGSLELSARTEQQAGALEETASSMEELTATVRHNADHTSQANALANSAQTLAIEGGKAVGAVVATMDSIKASSDQIADIIAVIDGIAFQTNILALNAAVEAARAGEQGRGFAVVASEVRNLAQRSAVAAKDIKALIQASTTTVEQGGTLVADAGVKIDAVVQGFGRVSQIIGEIATASGEQTTGIEQINLAVAEMDSMTQQNAALVEESTAAAQQMQEQAAALADLVGFFTVDGHARAPAAGAARRVAASGLPALAGALR